MAYSDFTLTDVKEKLFLSLAENENLFSQIESLDPSEHLKETLKYNVPLATAIHTEKARSELIVAPVLVEVIIGRGDKTPKSSSESLFRN
jgi:hypothetical protein